MKVGYSEFSFGYAFTKNMIRRSAAGPPSAPRFPNLVEEGTTGYDVRIDRNASPLFLQYKLPERLVRNNASEIKSRLRGIQTPFFRIQIMKRDASNQHKLLVDLESRFPRSVFYTAPCMWDETEFNQAYVSVEVHRRSVLFSPKEIGYLRDAEQHRLAYLPQLSYAWFCSEPRDIRVFRIEEISDERQQSMDEPRYRELGSVATEIRQSLRAVSPRELGGLEERARERIRDRRALRVAAPSDRRTEQVIEELQVSRELARVGLGIDLLIAQPR